MMKRTIDAVETIIKNYNLSDEAIEALRIEAGLSNEQMDDIVGKSVRYAFASKRKGNKDRRNKMKNKILRDVEKVNEKIMRELKKHESDPDALKMVYAETNKILGDVYKVSGKEGLDLNRSQIRSIVEDESRAESMIVNKSARMSIDRMYDELKVDVNPDNFESWQDYLAASRGLSEYRRRGRLMTDDVSGVKVTLKQRDEAQRLIDEANKVREEYNEKIKESNVEGHPDMFLTVDEREYSLDGVKDYDTLLNRINQLKKYSQEDYWENRAEIYKQNYIDAAYEVLPLDVAMEIEDIVRESDWVDFMRLARTHPAAEIRFMYESGGFQHEAILEILRRELT